MNTGENKRLFIGIQLSADLRAELSKVKDKTAFTATGRWIETDNMHLTLKFLGDCKSSLIGPISQRFQSIISNYQPFYLTTNFFGCFPSPKRAHILWLGLKDSDQLINIRNDIETGLTVFGYEPEKRKFHSHITLARFKKPANIGLDELNNSLKIDKRFKVNSVALFESRLSKRGARYSILKDFIIN